MQLNQLWLNESSTAYDNKISAAALCYNINILLKIHIHVKNVNDLLAHAEFVLHKMCSYYNIWMQ
jgi:hypothetical protein